MDIVVRGGKEIANVEKLMALRPDEEAWIWRGQKPLQAQVGDRVYFVKDGAVYLYAVYAGYDARSSDNLQGHRQSGMALLLKAPVKPVTPPFLLRTDMLKGRWLWRYDQWNLRRHIR